MPTYGSIDFRSIIKIENKSGRFLYLGNGVYIE